MRLERIIVLVVVCLGAVGATACARRPSATPPSSAVKGPLCRLVTVTELPPAQRTVGPGRWSVELPVDGPVLATHEARFAKRHITPNGEAWAGLLEQCLAKEGQPFAKDIHLDPEASSLHAWVESDRSRDRLVTAMCRAVDDRAWLDACLASVDRSQLDD